MRLATFVSPDDWTFNFGTGGKAGWRYILERLARVGITRVYWRVTTGWSYYASKINNTGPVFISTREIKAISKRRRWGMYDAIDWSQDDTLAAAVEYGNKVGIEVIAWMTLEDSHGPGSSSRLAHEHPEWMTVDRCGRRYYRLCGWAFPQVREWKLNLVREIMAYNPDGLLLDLGRFAYVTDPPTFGVSTGGYEEPMVEAFKEETGRDPFQIPNNDEDWIRFRARYLTQWVEIRSCLSILFHRAVSG